MKVLELRIPGLLMIEPDVFTDARGAFFETWHRLRYGAVGLTEDFVQDNVSLSAHGVLRGLHYQVPNPQGKLVTALVGEVYDVAVDIRVGSPTFGQWEGTMLSSRNGRQLYIPPGFAHGFQVTSTEALVHYKCTRAYDPQAQQSVLWSDEDIAVEWPLPPALSEKDRLAAKLRDLGREALPSFSAT